MKQIDYLPLHAIAPSEFLRLMNKPAIRTHLIDHPPFDAQTIEAWLAEKMRVDALPGCRVRAILADNTLAGWCGIQRESAGYDLAIIIDNGHWGIGLRVFRDMLEWAAALGHQSVYIHLLHTRRNYRFLEKLARARCETELLGRNFVRYEIPLPLRG